MPPLKVEDLTRIRENIRRLTKLRKGGKRAKITVHMGSCGVASGAKKILSAVTETIEKNKILDVIVTTSGCAGLCSREPMATVEIVGQSPVKYVDLTEKKIVEIIERYILEGELVEEYALAVGSERTHL
ncbi:MAG TPA: (2Fe-2S) ferredoxin domain-containing protein [archaeon]|nr:(2Fe-2S) ferredoxin domain-containing protein [archaeon]